MRRKVVAGNWKMNLTVPEAIALVDSLIKRVELRSDVDVVVCPSFIALYAVNQEIKGTHLGLGAQNMSWREHGAYTGQVSPGMLTSVGCQYVILGHSETRGRFGKPDEELVRLTAHFAESNETVNLKVKTALFHNLKPIVCVGETAEERSSDKTDAVIVDQVEKALEDVSSDEAYEMIFAYEPVWAIGTGNVCEKEEAERVCAHIRSSLQSILNHDAAMNIRILYGGSVKASNAVQLLRQPNIDGALVGGASLDADEFKTIVTSA